MRGRFVDDDGAVGRGRRRDEGEMRGEKKADVGRGKRGTEGRWLWPMSALES